MSLLHFYSFQYIKVSNEVTKVEAGDFNEALFIETGLNNNDVEIVDSEDDADFIIFLGDIRTLYRLRISISRAVS